MNKDVDLNLLKVLVLLERHRQLKPVAMVLGKSEASVSKYLTRLRTQLKDDLFVRHPHHLEPTVFLEQQLPLIKEALEQLESCLVREELDTVGYKQNITIRMPHSALYWFGRELLSELRRTFPNAFITLSSLISSTPDELLEGTVDVQLNYFNDLSPKAIYQKLIGVIPVSIVVPNELDVSTFDEATDLPFVLLEMIGSKEKEQVAKKVLEEGGFSINHVATLDDIPNILEVIKDVGAATFLHNYGPEIEGYRFIPIPLELYPEGRLPQVVVQMKQSNRYSQVHQHISDIIEKHLFSPSASRI